MSIHLTVTNNNANAHTMIKAYKQDHTPATQDVCLKPCESANVEIYAGCEIVINGIEGE